MSHSWFYSNDDYSDGWIELTAENAAADDEPFTPIIRTNLSFDACDEASANGILLDACAGEILRLGRRISDLEAVISERGDDLPRPTDIDFDAFEDMDPRDRFDAFMEAAGWALEARGWEKRAEKLEAEVEAALCGQVEISESGGRAQDQWRAEKAALEAEPARVRRELLALIDDANSGIYRKWDGYSYIEYAPLRIAIDGIIPPEAP